MKKLFLVPMLLLIAQGCMAQQPAKSFNSSIRDFKKAPLAKNNTLIFLRQLSANKNSSGGHADTRYLGEFPIDKISVFGKKEAADILKLLLNQASFVGDATGKSCAFIPTHVFILSHTSHKIIAYSSHCQQLAIFSADLKRLEAIGNLNTKGNDDVSQFIKSL